MIRLRSTLVGLLCIIGLMGMVSSTVFAQAKEITEGKEFYFGIPHCDIQNGEGARGTPVQLWLSCKVQTLVTVRLARTNDLIGIYPLLPKQVRKISIPEIYMCKTTGITDNGFYIKAEAPITATVYISYRWSGEAYRIIPFEVLGKRYHTLNLYQDRTERERPGQILVTATKDNTKVTVVPKTTLEDGTPAGGARTYVVHKGQTLLLKAKIQPGFTQDLVTDLTGTKIEATNPIAVVSGHTKGAFPRYSATMLGTPANFMRNMMIDAMYPVEFLGKEYFSAPVMYADRARPDFDADGSGDLIRVVAVEDGTLLYTQTADDNGKWQLRGRALKAGEYYDFNNQEKPCLYRTSKPSLIGQYGKAWRNSNVGPIAPPPNGGKADNSLQNPSRNGQGMMYVLTPKEQWCSYTTFHSPPEIDNFVMITFYTKDLVKMNFDNKPMRSTFNSYVKNVPGTDMSYIVAPIAAGDHTIEGTDNTVRFTAYVYGNWDRSKDGFAYGYPTGVNFSQPCTDSVEIKGVMECGVITGEANITPDTTSCGALFSVSMIDSLSNNYTFEFTTEFESGVKKASFKLTPKDNTKDAKATIYALTRSGKEAQISFEYFAEKLEIKPSTRVDFGSLPVGIESCKTLTIKNISKGTTTIKSMKLKKALPEFTFDAGTLPRTLQPGESFDITVCAKTSAPTTTSLMDELLSELTCYPQKIADLIVNSGQPCVKIEPVNFEPSPINNERGPKPCIIRNTSKFDVTVFKIIYNDQDKSYPDPRLFREDITLPLIVPANSTVSFNVWYTPKVSGANDVYNVSIETNADKACSEQTTTWTGSGIDAGPYIQGYDFKVQRALDRYQTEIAKINGYDGDIVIGAIGNTQLTDVKFTSFIAEKLPTGVSDWKTAFVLDETRLPQTLQTGANNEVRIPVKFTPAVIGDYRVRVTMEGKSGSEVKTATAIIEGIANLPVEDSLGYDFGTMQLGSPDRTGTAKIYSKGTRELIISNLEIRNDLNSAFRIEPTWLAATFGGGKTVTLAPQNGELDVPVMFNGKVPFQTAQVFVSCDLHPDEVKHPMLIGRTLGDVPVATPHNFGTEYKCNNKMSNRPGVNATDLKVENKLPFELEVESVSLKDANLSEVFVLENLGQIVNMRIPGASWSPLALVVRFRPALKQTYTSSFEWNLIDRATGTKYIVESPVTGVGNDLTVKVDLSSAEITENDLIIDNRKQITYSISADPDRIDDGKVNAFKAYVRYDKRVIKPDMSDKTTYEVSTENTLCAGWRVVQAVQVPDNDPNFTNIMVDVEAPTPTTYLQGTGALFTFNVRGVFDPNHKETLLQPTLELSPSSTGSSCWVNVNKDPGAIVIQHGCAAPIRGVSVEATQFALMNVRPNPVSNEVTIGFNVGYNNAATTITIYNAMGEQVAVPVNSVMNTGTYQVKVDLSNLSSGTYFYRMSSGHWTSDAQMLLISK